LDTEEEKNLLDESEKSVQFSKLKLDVINALRTQRIHHWKDMVWDRFEVKGCRIRVRHRKKALYFYHANFHTFSTYKPFT